MRKFDELKTTTNVVVYRRLYYDLILHCNRCAPNKGCNRRYKHKTTPYRSWKKYRRTQWKE